MQVDEARKTITVVIDDPDDAWAFIDAFGDEDGFSRDLLDAGRRLWPAHFDSKGVPLEHLRADSDASLSGSTEGFVADDEGQGTCCGRKPHDWGKVVRSAVFGATVQSCVRCGRLRRASLGGGKEADRG